MSPLIITGLSLLGWSLLGFMLTWFRWVNNATLKVLNKIILNVLLPFYILMTMIRHFEMTFFLQHSWVIFTQIIFILLAALLTLRWNRHPEKRFLFNILAFQNAGYIPIPIILLLPDHNHILFLLFLLLMGFNLSLFSLGYWLLNQKNNIREMFNMPLVASILGLLISLFGGVSPLYHLPAALLGSVLMIDHVNEIVMIPLILFVFGGTLVAHFSETKLSKADIPIQIDIALAKFIIIPLVLSALFWHADHAVRLLVVIEAIMPPAMNLLLLPEKEKDIGIMSRYLMVQYGVFLVLVVPILVGFLTLAR